MVIIVGTGKLANELLDSLGANGSYQVTPWTQTGQAGGASVVVHAGSGRELNEVIAYCQRNHATLVELATGSDIANLATPFPVVLCPNTNILMLKFMAMLNHSGHLFKGYSVQLTESHQAHKSSTPGTALAMARSLGLPAADVRSVRDAVEQEKVLNIAPEHLARHAYHQIVIEDAACRIALETRVYGSAPYAQGVARIIDAIHAQALENRRYDISEFIERGWI